MKYQGTMTRGRTFAFIGLLFAVLLLSFRLQIFGAGGMDSPASDLSGKAGGFACGEGEREGRELWGKAGYSRGCYRDGLPHGRWTYWEEGYMNLEGFFKNGQKHGAWTVFNEDGTIYVKISFEEGEKTGKRYY